MIKQQLLQSFCNKFKVPGVDPGFLKGGLMIPIGHQTICQLILSCCTFVPKHGDLERTMVGWLHKVFTSHVFPFVSTSIIFFGRLFKRKVASHSIHSSWIQTLTHVLSCLNRVLKPIHTDYQAAPETLRI